MCLCVQLLECPFKDDFEPASLCLYGKSTVQLILNKNTVIMRAISQRVDLLAPQSPHLHHLYANDSADWEELC